MTFNDFLCSIGSTSEIIMENEFIYIMNHNGLYGLSPEKLALYSKLDLFWRKGKEYLLTTIRTCLPNSRKYSIYLLQYSSYKLFLSLMGFFSSVSYYSFSRHLNKQYYHIYKTSASSISIDRFYLISKEFFQN